MNYQTTIIKNSRRFVAAFVAVTFLVTQGPSTTLAVSTPQSDSHKNLVTVTSASSDCHSIECFQLPESLGKIQSHYQGDQSRTVVLIQDAHAIPEAQRHIQEIIGHFQNQYGADLVAVEGASEELDTQFFKSFPDPEKLKQVLQNYSDKGELTGAATRAILNSGSLRYQGIEDAALYEEGLRFYHQAMAQKKSLLRQIRAARKELQIQKKQIYSHQLLALDKKISDFHRKRLDLTYLLTYLNKIQPPAAGTDLAILTQTLQEEKKDQTNQDRELREIAKNIKTYFSRQHSSRFEQGLSVWNQKYQEFQTGQIAGREYALYLKTVLSENTSPFSLHRIQEHLEKLSGDAQKIQNMQGPEIFEELEEYILKIKTSLFRNEEEKRLDQQGHRLDLREKLARLELSRKEWNEIASPAVQAPNDFAVAFYQNAELREEAFLKNLPSLRGGVGNPSPVIASPLPQAGAKQSPGSGQARNDDVIILIAGGFHTEGLVKRLQEQKISYAVVMPRIDKLSSQDFYRQHMRGEISWKHYLKIENGQVDLYKAFARAVRDQLIPTSSPLVLSQDEGAALLLKMWRDQIIRDLAMQKRTGDANQHTSLIDEVMRGEDAASYLPQWQVNVEKFLEKFRELNTQKQVTVENVSKILNPASILGALDGNLLLQHGSIAADLVMPPAARSEARVFEKLDEELRNALAGIGVPGLLIVKGSWMPVTPPAKEPSKNEAHEDADHRNMAAAGHLIKMALEAGEEMNQIIEKTKAYFEASSTVFDKAIQYVNSKPLLVLKKETLARFRRNKKNREMVLANLKAVIEALAKHYGLQVKEDAAAEIYRLALAPGQLNEMLQPAAAKAPIKPPREKRKGQISETPLLSIPGKLQAAWDSIHPWIFNWISFIGVAGFTWYLFYKTQEDEIFGAKVEVADFKTKLVLSLFRLLMTVGWIAVTILPVVLFKLWVSGSGFTVSLRKKEAQTPIRKLSADELSEKEAARPLDDNQSPRSEARQLAKESPAGGEVDDGSLKAAEARLPAGQAGTLQPGDIVDATIERMHPHPRTRKQFEFQIRTAGGIVGTIPYGGIPLSEAAMDAKQLEGQRYVNQRVRVRFVKINDDGEPMFSLRLADTPEAVKARGDYEEGNSGLVLDRVESASQTRGPMVGKVTAIKYKEGFTLDVEKTNLVPAGLIVQLENQPVHIMIFILGLEADLQQRLLKNPESFIGKEPNVFAAHRKSIPIKHSKGPLQQNYEFSATLRSEARLPAGQAGTSDAQPQTSPVPTIERELDTLNQYIQEFVEVLPFQSFVVKNPDGRNFWVVIKGLRGDQKEIDIQVQPRNTAAYYQNAGALRILSEWQKNKTVFLQDDAIIFPSSKPEETPVKVFFSAKDGETLRFLVQAAPGAVIEKILNKPVPMAVSRLFSHPPATGQFAEAYHSLINMGEDAMDDLRTILAKETREKRTGRAELILKIIRQIRENTLALDSQNVKANPLGLEVVEKDGMAGFRYIADTPKPVLNYDLWMVPHGTTDNNARNVLHGQRTNNEGSHLNEAGRAEALAGAEQLWQAIGEAWLADPKQFVFLQTGSHRSQETAAIYSQYFKRQSRRRRALNIKTSDFGLEIDFGRYDGMTVEEVKTKHGRRAARRARQYREGDVAVSFPNGQSFLDYSEQVVRQLEQANVVFSGKKVILFGHGTFTNAADTLLQNTSRVEISPDSGLILWRKHHLKRGFAVQVASRSEARTLSTASGEYLDRTVMQAIFSDLMTAGKNQIAFERLQELARSHPKGLAPWLPWYLDKGDEIKSQIETLALQIAEKSPVPIMTSMAGALVYRSLQEAAEKIILQIDLQHDPETTRALSTFLGMPIGDRIVTKIAKKDIQAIAPMLARALFNHARWRAANQLLSDIAAAQPSSVDIIEASLKETWDRMPFNGAALRVMNQLLASIGKPPLVMIEEQVSVPAGSAREQGNFLVKSLSEPRTRKSAEAKLIELGIQDPANARELAYPLAGKLQDRNHHVLESVERILRAIGTPTIQHAQAVLHPLSRAFISHNSSQDRIANIFTALGSFYPKTIGNAVAKYEQQKKTIVGFVLKQLELAAWRLLEESPLESTSFGEASDIIQEEGEDAINRLRDLHDKINRSQAADSVSRAEKILEMMRQIRNPAPPVLELRQSKRAEVRTEGTAKAKLRILFADKPGKMDALMVFAKQYPGDIEILEKYTGIGSGPDALNALKQVFETEHPDVVFIRSDSDLKDKALLQALVSGRENPLPPVILRGGADTDNVNLEAAKELGIVVSRAHGSQNSVANLFLRFLLAYFEKIQPGIFEKVSDNALDFSNIPGWQDFLDLGPEQFLAGLESSQKKKRGELPPEQTAFLFSASQIGDGQGPQLKALLEKTRLAFLGFGAIPIKIAEKYHQMGEITQAKTGMMAISRSLEDPSLDQGAAQTEAKRLGIEIATKQHILETANVISVHLPGKVKKYLGVPEFEILAKRKGPIALINTSREANVDHEALRTALRAKMDLYYFADIDLIKKGTPVEILVSLANEFPDQVFLVPHIGASTPDATAAVEAQTLLSFQELFEIFSGKKEFSQAQLDYVVPISPEGSLRYQLSPHTDINPRSEARMDNEEIIANRRAALQQLSTYFDDEIIEIDAFGENISLDASTTKLAVAFGFVEWVLSSPDQPDYFRFKEESAEGLESFNSISQQIKVLIDKTAAIREAHLFGEGFYQGLDKQGYFWGLRQAVNQFEAIKIALLEGAADLNAIVIQFQVFESSLRELIKPALFLDEMVQWQGDSIRLTGSLVRAVALLDSEKASGVELIDEGIKGDAIVLQATSNRYHSVMTRKLTEAADLVKIIREWITARAESREKRGKDSRLTIEPPNKKLVPRFEARIISAEKLGGWVNRVEILTTTKNPATQIKKLRKEIKTKLQPDEQGFFENAWERSFYGMRYENVPKADRIWIDLFLVLSAAVLSSQNLKLKDLRRLDALIQKWNLKDSPQKWNFSLTLLMQLVTNSVATDDKLKAMMRLAGKGITLPGEYRYKMAAFALYLLGMHVRTSILSSVGFDEISADFNPKRSLKLAVETLSSEKFSEDVPEELYEELKLGLQVGLTHFIYGSARAWAKPSNIDEKDHHRILPLQDFIVQHRQVLAKTVREIQAKSKETSFSYLGSGIPWIFENILVPYHFEQNPPAVWDRILLNGFKPAYQPFYYQFMVGDHNHLETEKPEDYRKILAGEKGKHTYSDRADQIYTSLIETIEKFQPGPRSEQREARLAQPVAVAARSETRSVEAAYALGITAGSAAVIALAVGLAISFWKRRQRQKPLTQEPPARTATTPSIVVRNWDKPTDHDEVMDLSGIGEISLATTDAAQSKLPSLTEAEQHLVELTRDFFNRKRQMPLKLERPVGEEIRLPIPYNSISEELDPRAKLIYLLTVLFQEMDGMDNAYVYQQRRAVEESIRKAFEKGYGPDFEANYLLGLEEEFSRFERDIIAHMEKLPSTSKEIAALPILPEIQERYPLLPRELKFLLSQNSPLLEDEDIAGKLQYFERKMKNIPPLAEDLEQTVLKTFADYVRDDKGAQAALQENRADEMRNVRTDTLGLNGGTEDNIQPALIPPLASMSGMNSSWAFFIGLGWLVGYHLIDRIYARRNIRFLKKLKGVPALPFSEKFLSRQFISIKPHEKLNITVSSPKEFSPVEIATLIMVVLSPFLSVTALIYAFPAFQAWILGITIGSLVGAFSGYWPFRNRDALPFFSMLGGGILASLAGAGIFYVFHANPLIFYFLAIAGLSPLIGGAVIYLGMFGFQWFYHFSIAAWRRGIWPFYYERLLMFHALPAKQLTPKIMHGVLQALEAIPDNAIRLLMEHWMDNGQYHKVQILQKKPTAGIKVWAKEIGKVYQDFINYEATKKIMVQTFSAEDLSKEEIIATIKEWRQAIEKMDASGINVLQAILPEFIGVENNFRRIKFWINALLKDKNTPWKSDHSFIMGHYVALKHFMGIRNAVKKKFQLTEDEVRLVVQYLIGFMEHMPEGGGNSRGLDFLSMILSTIGRTIAEDNKQSFFAALNAISQMPAEIFETLDVEEFIVTFERLIGYRLAKIQFGKRFPEGPRQDLFQAIYALEQKLKERHLDPSIVLLPVYSKLAQVPVQRSLSLLEGLLALDPSHFIWGQKQESVTIHRDDSNDDQELLTFQDKKEIAKHKEYQGPRSVADAYGAWIDQELAKRNLIRKDANLKEPAAALEQKLTPKFSIGVFSDLKNAYEEVLPSLAPENRVQLISAITRASDNHAPLLLRRLDLVAGLLDNPNANPDIAALPGLFQMYEDAYGPMQGFTLNLLRALTNRNVPVADRVKRARSLALEQRMLSLGFPLNAVHVWDAISFDKLVAAVGEDTVKRRTRNSVVKKALARMGHMGLYTHWEMDRPPYYQRFLQEMSSIDPDFFKPGEKFRVAYDRDDIPGITDDDEPAGTDEKKSKFQTLMPVQDPVLAFRHIIAQLRAEGFEKSYVKRIKPEYRDHPESHVTPGNIHEFEENLSSRFISWSMKNEEIKISILVRLFEIHFHEQTKAVLGDGNKTQQIDYWKKLLQFVQEEAVKPTAHLKKENKFYSKVVDQIEAQIAGLVASQPKQQAVGRKGVVQFILTRGSPSDFFRGEVSGDCCRENTAPTQFPHIIGLPTDPAFLAFKLVEDGSWIGNIYAMVFKRKDKTLVYLDQVTIPRDHNLAAGGGVHDTDRKYLAQKFVERFEKVLGNAGFDYLVISPASLSIVHDFQQDLYEAFTGITNYSRFDAHFDDIDMALEDVPAELVRRVPHLRSRARKPRPGIETKMETVTKPGGLSHQSDFGVKLEYIQGISAANQGRGLGAQTHTYIGEENFVAGLWIPLAANKKLEAKEDQQRSELRSVDRDTFLVAAGIAGLATRWLIKEIQFWKFKHRVLGSPREALQNIPLDEFPSTAQTSLAGRIEVLKAELGRVRYDLEVLNDTLNKNPRNREALLHEREILIEALAQYEQQMIVLRENARKEDFERGLELLRPILKAIPNETWKILRKHFPGAEQKGAFPMTLESVTNSMAESWAQSQFFRNIIGVLENHVSFNEWFQNKPFYLQFKQQAENIGLKRSFDKPGEKIRFQIPDDHHVYSLELSERDPEYLLRGFFSGDCTNCGPQYAVGSFITATGTHIANPAFLNFKFKRDGEWVGNIYAIVMNINERPVLLIDAIQIPWDKASPLFIPYKLDQSQFAFKEKEIEQIVNAVLSAFGQYAKKVHFQEVWLSKFVSNFSRLKAYFKADQADPIFDRTVFAGNMLGGFEALQGLGYEQEPYIESFRAGTAKAVWPSREPLPNITVIRSELRHLLSGSGYVPNEDETHLIQEAIDRGEKVGPFDIKEEIHRLAFDELGIFMEVPESLKEFIDDSDFHFVRIRPPTQEGDLAPPTGLGVELGSASRDIYTAVTAEPKQETGFVVTLYVGDELYEQAGESAREEILMHGLYLAYRTANKEDAGTYPLDVDFEIELNKEIERAESWEAQVPDDEKMDLGLQGGKEHEKELHVRARAFARFFGELSSNKIGTSYTDLLRHLRNMRMHFSKPREDDERVARFADLPQGAFDYLRQQPEENFQPPDFELLFSVSGYIQQNKNEDLMDFFAQRVTAQRKMILLHSNAPTPWILGDIRRLVSDLSKEGIDAAGQNAVQNLKLKHLYLDLPPELDTSVQEFLETGRGEETLLEAIKPRFSALLGPGMPEEAKKEFERPDLYIRILKAVREHNADGGPEDKIHVHPYYKPQRDFLVPDFGEMPFLPNPPGNHEDDENGNVGMIPLLPFGQQGQMPPMPPGFMPEMPAIPAPPASTGVKEAIVDAITKSDADPNALILFVKPLDEYLLPEEISNEKVVSVLHIDKYTGFGPQKPENSLALYMSEQASPTQRTFALPILAEAPFYNDAINPGVPPGFDFNLFRTYPDLILSTSGKGEGQLEITQDEPSPESIVPDEPLVPVAGSRSEARLPAGQAGEINGGGDVFSGGTQSTAQNQKGPSPQLQISLLHKVRIQMRSLELSFPPGYISNPAIKSIAITANAIKRFFIGTVNNPAATIAAFAKSINVFPNSSLLEVVNSFILKSILWGITKARAIEAWILLLVNKLFNNSKTSKIGLLPLGMSSLQSIFPPALSRIRSESRTKGQPKALMSADQAKQRVERINEILLNSTIGRPADRPRKGGRPKNKDTRSEARMKIDQEAKELTRAIYEANPVADTAMLNKRLAAVSKKYREMIEGFKSEAKQQESPFTTSIIYTDFHHPKSGWFLESPDLNGGAFVFRIGRDISPEDSQLLSMRIVFDPEGNLRLFEPGTSIEERTVVPGSIFSQTHSIPHRFLVRIINPASDGFKTEVKRQVENFLHDKKLGMETAQVERTLNRLKVAAEERVVVEEILPSELAYDWHGILSFRESNWTSPLDLLEKLDEIFPIVEQILLTGKFASPGNLSQSNRALLSFIRSELRAKGELKMTPEEVIEARQVTFLGFQRKLLGIFSDYQKAKSAQKDGETKKFLRAAARLSKFLDPYINEIRGVDVTERAQLGYLNRFRHSQNLKDKEWLTEEGRTLSDDIKSYTRYFVREYQIYQSSISSEIDKQKALKKLENLNVGVTNVLKRRLKVQHIRLQNELEAGKIDQATVFSLLMSIQLIYYRLAYEHYWRALRRGETNKPYVRFQTVDPAGYITETLDYERQPLLRIETSEAGEMDLSQILWRYVKVDGGEKALQPVMTRLHFQELAKAFRSREHALESEQADYTQLKYHDFALQGVVDVLDWYEKNRQELPEDIRDSLVTTLESVLHGPNGQRGLRLKRKRLIVKGEAIPMPKDSLELAQTEIQNGQLKQARLEIENARLWIQTRREDIASGTMPATKRKRDYLYLLIRDDAVFSALNSLRELVKKGGTLPKETQELLERFEATDQTYFKVPVSEMGGPEIRHFHTLERELQFFLGVMRGLQSSVRMRSSKQLESTIAGLAKDPRLDRTLAQVKSDILRRKAVLARSEVRGENKNQIAMSPEQSEALVLIVQVMPLLVEWVAQKTGSRIPDIEAAVRRLKELSEKIGRSEARQPAKESPAGGKANGSLKAAEAWTATEPAAGSHAEVRTNTVKHNGEMIVGNKRIDVSTIQDFSKYADRPQGRVLFLAKTSLKHGVLIQAAPKDHQDAWKPAFYLQTEGDRVEIFRFQPLSNVAEHLFDLTESDHKKNLPSEKISFWLHRSRGGQVGFHASEDGLPSLDYAAFSIVRKGESDFSTLAQSYQTEPVTPKKDGDSLTITVDKQGQNKIWVQSPERDFLMARNPHNQQEFLIFAMRREGIPDTSRPLGRIYLDGPGVTIEGLKFELQSRNMFHVIRFSRDLSVDWGTYQFFYAVPVARSEARSAKIVVTGSEIKKLHGAANKIKKFNVAAMNFPSETHELRDAAGLVIDLVEDLADDEPLIDAFFEEDLVYAISSVLNWIYEVFPEGDSSEIAFISATIRGMHLSDFFDATIEDLDVAIKILNLALNQRSEFNPDRQLQMLIDQDSSGIRHLLAGAAQDQVKRQWMLDHPKIIDEIKNRFQKTKDEFEAFAKTKGLRAEIRRVAGDLVSGFRNQFAGFDSLDLARQIVAADAEEFVTAVETEVRRYVDLDMQNAAQGFAAVLSKIDQPTMIRMELSATQVKAMQKGNALQRFIDTISGAIRANKYVLVRLQVPYTYEGEVRGLLARRSKRDPVSIKSAGDNLVLYHEAVDQETDVANVKPTLTVAANYDLNKGAQLDGTHYQNGPTIEAQNMTEVFTAGLLWVADSLSQQTADLITQDASREAWHQITSPAALGVLAHLGNWLASARVVRVAA